MQTPQTSKPKCESCSMPMDNEFVSKQDPRYCVYCQDQDSGELASFEQVRQGSIDAAIGMLGMDQKQAEKMADDLLQKLPRWKDK